jgi:hypothetical protein
MLNISKSQILCLFTIFLVNCKNDDGNIEFPYFVFNQSDNSLIITYDYSINEIITYENQNGEQLNFKVVQNEITKQSDYSEGGFSGGGGNLESYYDSKIIKLEIIENQDYESNGLVNYIFSKSNDSFKSGMNFPLWNILNPTFIDELRNNANIPLMAFNDLPKIQGNINGHIFEKIVIIDSQSMSINQDSSYGTLTKNINIIYYDYDFGIVQFNDIQGNEWKLIYPE